MYASESLTSAGRRWRSAADALLAQAERIGPLDVGVFGELGDDEAGQEAAARRIDEQVDELLREGDSVFAELESPSAASADARFQITSLLVGTLAVGNALAVADQPPTDVFGELSVEDAQSATFADARTVVAEADAIVAVPSSLKESLDEIAAAGATESWELVSGGVGSLAGGALVGGLDGILKGTAAVAFDLLQAHLSGLRNTLKRGAARIATWVVEKFRSFLPREVADKVDKLVEKLQEVVEDKAGEIATDVYGRLLGRDETESAWTDAAGGGKDLTEAEGSLAGITAAHSGRIAWVTKGRKQIEKFDTIVAGAVTTAGPAVQLAFAALVAALVGFVAVQVWDGFNDIAALV